MPNDLSPPNDPSIPDGEFLYHRVYPDLHCIFIDPASKEPRPSSAAFRSKRKEPLSVELASLTTPEESRSRAPKPDFYLARVQAGEVRGPGCECGIVKDPETNNKAHALLYGRGEGGALTKGQREKIAQRARFEIVDEQAVMTARLLAAGEEG